MRLFLALLLACFTLSCISAEKKPDPKEITLIIWAGQSNAQGWMGDAAKYPADSAGLDKQIPLFYNSPGIGSSDNKWITMGPQKGRFPAGHFGPEVSFARELKQKGVNVAVFKYTLGSTSIANNWKQPGDKAMYDNMVAALKTAVKLQEDQGFKVKYGGFVWIQGESDAQTPAMAKAYKAKLETLIKDLRDKVTKTPDLPVILGVDEQHDWVVKNPEVVTAQEKLAKELKKCTATSMKGFPKADGTHLTPEGLVKHGENLAAAYLKLR